MNTAQSRPPLRVLHVFSTFVSAGPQVRTAQLINGLGPEFEHTVIACDNELGARELVQADRTLTCLPCPSKAGPLGGLRAWRKFLQKHPFDLLATYNWGSFDAVLAAHTLNLTSHIHHEDGFNADEAAGQRARRVWARRIGLNRAHRTVVPSKHLEAVALNSWHISQGRLRKVVNGVDCHRFSRSRKDRERIRRNLGLTPEDWLVGSVGHLRPVKRFDRLFETIASLRAGPGGERVHLALVGAGPEESSLRQHGTDLGLDECIHWAGHQSELMPWYSAMDVFCLTSDSEQLPLSLLEAMACELPVVATDVGDIRCTLPPSSGSSLVDHTDADAPNRLASHCHEFLTSPALRRSTGLLHRTRVQADYSLESMIDAYRRLYRGAAQR